MNNIWNKTVRALSYAPITIAVIFLAAGCDLVFLGATGSLQWLGFIAGNLLVVILVCAFLSKDFLIRWLWNQQ